MNRRIFALLLAAAMLLALAACGKNNTPEETGSGIISGVDDGNLDDAEVQAAAPVEDNTPAATEESVVQTETTVPAVTDPEEESAQSTTAPENETTAPSAPAAEMTEYEWYNSLSGEEQMAFMESFDSVPAFFDWYNAAKEEYEKLYPSIEIGDGVIDLGELVGGNG